MKILRKLFKKRCRYCLRKGVYREITLFEEFKVCVKHIGSTSC